MCRKNPAEKGKYIKIILALLQSPNTAVVYECAVTLVSLSQAPTAIRAAANCYCQLLVSQSDDNVRLIVLDGLQVCAAAFGCLACVMQRGAAAMLALDYISMLCKLSARLCEIAGFGLYLCGQDC